MTDFEAQVSEILKELERTHFLERHKLLTKFIEDTLSLRDQVYQLSERDLTYIHSVAADFGRTLSPHLKFGDKELSDNPSLFQSLAWTQAVLTWLRSQSMISFIVRGDGE